MNVEELRYNKDILREIHENGKLFEHNLDIFVNR